MDNNPAPSKARVAGSGAAEPPGGSANANCEAVSVPVSEHFRLPPLVVAHTSQFEFCNGTKVLRETVFKPPPAF